MRPSDKILATPLVMYHQKTLEVVMHCQEKLSHRQKDFASRHITSERKMFQSSYKPLKDEQVVIRRQERLLTVRKRYK